MDITSRKPAIDPTTAYLLYDDKNLYVAFDCIQKHAPISATQVSNNVGFGFDDYVEVDIDIRGNGSLVYRFEATPNGVKYQQSGESSRFNPDWQARGGRATSGWFVIMVIPLKALRTANTPEQSWRINFQRSVAATNDSYTWAYDPRMIYPSDTQWWPKLADIKLPVRKVRPQPREDVYGLVSGGHDYDQFEQTTGIFARQTPRHVGLDGVFPLTNTLGFVYAFNPDFSNVEADQVIIAPQEFPFFYQEYRPFFAQGANYLNLSYTGSAVSSSYTPNALFYTPSIGTFNRGLKVEGTEGLDSIGVLEAEGAGFDDLAYGFGQATADSSFRWWTQGVLANHSDGRDATLEGGLDTNNLRSGLEEALQFDTESGTFVTDTSLAQNILATVADNKSNHDAGIIYRDVGPEYAPVDGYTQINDTRGPIVYADFYPGGQSSDFYKRIVFSIYADRYLDHSGAVRESDTDEYLAVQTQKLLTFSVNDLDSNLRSYASSYPVYMGGTTQAYHQTSFFVGYALGLPTSASVSYSTGPFGPMYLQLSDISGSHAIGKHLQVNLSYQESNELEPDNSHNSQLLRGVTLSDSISATTSLTAGLRDVSGTGGFSVPGNNLAVGLHERFAGGNELFINYGSPAATATLQRLIVKYVLHIGGAAGS